MFLRRGIAGGLVVLLLAAGAARAQDAGADVFTIPRVPADATAANATAARDQALADGQRKAFNILMARLTLPTDAARLPNVNATQLTDLVQGFEVGNERRSGVRYLADYTFHFRPEAVRQLLRQSGIAFAETPSKPLVVLPVLHDGDRTVLWDDPNPWRDAWNSLKLPLGLVPVVTPLGDLNDVAAVDADTAARGEPEHLAAVSQRYGGADVLVTQAVPKTDGSDGVDVTTTRYTPGVSGSEQTWVTSETANAGEGALDLMRRAAGDTMAQVEEAWKVANILDTRLSGTLVARVPVGALPEWIAVRDRLVGIPAVRSSQLVSLDHDGALVEIRYIGDPAQLRLALGQRDLELSGTDPDWVLRRRGSAGGGGGSGGNAGVGTGGDGSASGANGASGGAVAR
jgi:hypothetical protein